MIWVLIRLYSLLISLYPRKFITEFGEEMKLVFADSIRQHNAQSILMLIREIRDFPASWLDQVSEIRHLGGSMTHQEEVVAPSSRWEAFIGVLPFLGYGIAYMYEKIVPLPSMRVLHDLPIVYGLVLVGLLIGWIRGFPLWSYSYLGWALVIAWFDRNVHVNGVSQGYKILIPLGMTVAIALIWTRSLNPIKQLLSDIWHDWTRLCLAIYAFGGFMNMGYDENHHPYLLIFMLFTTLIVTAGAWFFLRSGSIVSRVLSIALGFIAASILGGICYATWDFYAYHSLPNPYENWYQRLIPATIGIFFGLLIIFFPAIIAVVQRVLYRKLPER